MRDPFAPADIRAQSDEQRLYVVPPDGRAGGATEDRAERLLMSTVQSVCDTVELG